MSRFIVIGTKESQLGSKKKRMKEVGQTKRTMEKNAIGKCFLCDFSLYHRYRECEREIEKGGIRRVGVVSGH